MARDKTLQERLQEFRTMILSRNFDGIKTAVFGSSGGDTSFETAFANLAHVNLRERAPRLLPYEVGFELLDRSSDDTKAAGMFAFKMNDSWLYAPIFFLNGNLKGDELLFLKSQDIFIPLKDKWVDFVLNRKPITLGKNVDKNMRDKGVRQPDFQSIVRPVAKRGSVLPHVTGWRRDLLTKVAELAYTMPDMTEVPSLPDFLTKAAKYQPNLIDTFLGWCKYQPQFKKAVSRYYDDSIFKLAAELAVTSRIPDTNFGKYASRSSRLDFEDAAGPQPRVYKYAADLEDGGDTDLTVDEKEKLINDGILVKDERTEDQVSQAVTIKGPKSLENPVGTGLYSVLLKPGTFVKALVLVGMRGEHGKVPHTYVKFLEGPYDGKYALLSSKDIWTLHKYTDEDFRKFYDDLPEASSVPVRASDDYGYAQRVVFLGPRGQCSAPILLGIELGGSDGSSVYSITVRSYPDKKDNHLGIVGEPDYCGCGDDDPTLTLVDDKGSFRVSGGNFQVPANFKRVMGKPIDYEDRAIFGDWSDLELDLHNKTAALFVATTPSGQFVINLRPFGKTAALQYLIENQGLDLPTTDTLLKEAATYGRADYRIKYAPGFPKVAVNAPWMDLEPNRGSEPLLGGAEAEYGREQTARVEGLGSEYNPPRPDPTAVQEALAASQSGSSEIFDASTFKGLVNAVREDDYVEEFTGDLIKAMDRLGRILMLFYWHSEDFEERYGREELPEMEDTLKNTFESMGDLILKLRQKSIKSYGDSMGLDLAQAADN